MNREHVAREKMGRADAARIGANMSGLDRPKNVARFEWLMYSSLGIGIICTAPTFGDLDAPAIGYIPFLLGFFWLQVWLIARRRKNWARWSFLIFLDRGALSRNQRYDHFAQMSSAVAMWRVVRHLVQLAALCCSPKTRTIGSGADRNHA
jgi:hypothetical protein